ncbi:kinase-like domain-containing protein [Plectosphaerella cucumerina]|uniref:cyclin-dependent kinase n=1 Tax=Plectosphaerella cucumerina TaxID=40658 RepID=A0A8K0TBB6_9PEZI|nr:kinase-like domain-containing protein [Plectosphaerella cucumerina]
MTTAESQEWRHSLSASERFDNIERMKASLQAAGPEVAATAPSESFLLESRAYDESHSRAQYDEICRVVGLAAPALVQPKSDGHENGQRPKVTIGAYQDCQLIAGGVTSEVYKSGNKALKVIVETRNIEPHHPQREAKILATLKRPCIPLLETFRDQEQRFVLVFPLMPMTLGDLLEKGSLPLPRVQRIFRDVFEALRDLHEVGIIHRDIKPSAILLESSDGPAYLSDFGTAWHPAMSAVAEPPNGKILDVGTSSYRAPECLFGDKSYGTAVDMWAAGAMLAEACRDPPKPLFESRQAHEDGNQLGLILSIFKTLGTPTVETWPEATHFKTPPFQMYQPIAGHTWEEILPDIQPDFRQLISSLVRFDSKRATAADALQHACLTDIDV